MPERKLIVFMNSYTKGYSGGDVCLIEMLKRIFVYRRLVVTSALGEKLCRENGLDAEYILTTREKRFTNLMWIYALRIVRSFFLKIKVDNGDIIYASSDFLTDVIPAFSRKKASKGAKWVQKIFHIIPLSRPIPHYAQKISFSFIRRSADTIIVDNSLLKDELVRRNFLVDKIRINYPGIDFTQNHQPAGKAPDIQAVFLGRFHYSKGLFDLVEIWGMVCQRFPQAKLSVIGGGNDNLRGKLENNIRSAGMENNIALTGRIDKDEIVKIMRSAKVFVFPSHEEGFGIAIAEAMACGLAVVAWDLAVYREVFSDCIIRVKENDFSAFAKEVIGLLEDEGRRLSLARQGNEFIKRYSWDNAVKKELEFIAA